MIIQCEECRTRFRLADEKLKATGTKVRCSKCKHVFTVMPAAPEPVDENVDFDAMNMEAVSGQAAAAQESATAQSTAGQEDPESNSDLEFSGLEQQVADKEKPSGALDEEFSFGGKEPSGEVHSETDDLRAPAGGDFEASTDEDAGGFTFEIPPETDRSPYEETEPGDFSFGDNEPAENGDFDNRTGASEASSEEPPETEAFSFDEPERAETSDEDADAADAFAFDDPGDAAAVNTGDKTPEPADDDEFGMGDRVETFDFNNDEAVEWEDVGESDETGFDFDAPAFESEKPSASVEETGDESLQFGEIKFASEPEEDAHTYQTANDSAEESFASAEAFRQEPAGRSPQYQGKAASRTSDEELLPPASTRRKSPLNRILGLLILLLLVLGGAAGYFYMQDGSLDINRIIQRLTGETQPGVSENRIGINITGSSYVNNPNAGQLLIVQGEAVNNFSTARSAITVKGILLDAQGKTLFQQTVSCGNFLDEKAISRMPFDKIEEAMNNQFGDSLSNMNVAAGAAIPFTIVFRNLPEGIANINVEVVGSKMGSS